jgi:hypothetical protein
VIILIILFISFNNRQQEPDECVAKACEEVDANRKAWINLSSLNGYGAASKYDKNGKE